MKKLITTLYCFVIIILGVHAQRKLPVSKTDISGYVKDSASGMPMARSTIVLKNINSSLSYTVTADSTGHFIFKNVPINHYRLLVSYSGYKTFSKNYFLADSSTSLITETIKLVPAVLNLKDVTVTSTKNLVENKPDRIIYNVEKDVTSQGGVATDVLRKIPQVTVDINGNVELLGNPSVRFLINGKPSTVFGNSIADALQSIPASQIQSIEVMSNPGAKFDASGTGGIINIILKKGKTKGFSGLVNVTAGTRLENGSLNLNYKKNNVGVTGYFSGSSQLKTKTLTTANRNSVDTATGNNYFLNQDGSSDFARFGYRAGLGIDWDINVKDNLSFSISNFHFGNTNTGNTDQLNTEQDKYGATVFSENSIRYANTGFNNNTWEAGLDYRRKLKKDKQEISFSYNYSKSANNSSYEQSRRYPLTDSIFAGSNSSNPGKDYLHEISLDYSDPLSKNFVFETGIKSEIEKIVSNSDVFTFSQALYKYQHDDLQSYTSTFNRQVLAGYISASFKVSKSLNVIAGARLEHTFNQVTYSKNKNIKIPDYNNAGPALTLLYTFKKLQTLKFSYAYRLERPEYRDLNPFVNLADPHNIITGNPYMVPEIGNNFQLGYNQSFGNDNNLNIVFVYTYNSPDIKSFTTFYPAYKVGDSVYTNVNVIMRSNIASETRLGLNIAGSFKPLPKFNVGVNIQLYNRKTNNKFATPAIISGFEYRGNVNLNYQFTHGLTAEAFGNYNSGLRWQGRRAAFSSYTIAVRKQMLKGKISFGFTAVNAFGKYLTQRSTQTGTGFNGNNIIQIPYRSFGISLLYKFGKIRISKPKEEENYLTSPPIDN